MGGNVFSNNIRIESKSKLQKLFQKQENLLNFITPNLLMPRQIDSKETFGDLDILVDEEYKEDIAALVESLNIPNNIERNIHNNEIINSVISYQWEGKYQIDLIFLPKDKLEYAYNFFSYGDHGSLLSTILFKNNLKNSFNGLIENIYKNNGNFKRTILVSNDYFKMLEYLKLDIKKFESGFDTEEDLFNWISSSPYFEKDIYNPKNKNHKHRARNKKRPFYINFLNYLETSTFTNPKTPLPPANTSFSLYDLRIKQVEEEYRILEEYKKKVNGKVVSEVTGAQGHEIRKILRELNLQYTKEEILLIKDSVLKTLLKRIYQTSVDKIFTVSLKDLSYQDIYLIEKDVLKDPFHSIYSSIPEHIIIIIGRLLDGTLVEGGERSAYTENIEIDVQDFLQKYSLFGISFKDYLKENYY